MPIALVMLHIVLDCCHQLDKVRSDDRIDAPIALAQPGEGPPARASHFGQTSALLSVLVVKVAYRTEIMAGICQFARTNLVTSISLLSVPSLIRNRKGSIPIGNLCILEQSLPICVQVFQFSVPSTVLWFDHPDWDWSSPVQEGNRRLGTMGIPLFGRNVTRLSTSTGCRGIWCIHQVCPSVASTI